MPPGQVQQLLEKRHRIRLDIAALAERAARIERSLSASQRWSLLCRFGATRQVHPIDPTRDAVCVAERTIPLRSRDRGPESRLAGVQARAALREALENVAPHKRTALILRFRFCLPIRRCARVMGATDGQVDHWVREGMGDIREHLRRHRIVREDLEAHELGGIWS
jgi:DNA-directed RNA polymerase specialized sigma24 family protein